MGRSVEAWFTTEPTKDTKVGETIPLAKASDVMHMRSLAERHQNTVLLHARSCGGEGSLDTDIEP